MKRLLEKPAVSGTLARLSQLCRKRLPALYRVEQRSKVHAQLDTELSYIARRSLAAHTLDAVGLAKRLRRDGTACRLVGSGCSSLVTYLVGLSDIDPIRYRLPFQRFYATSNNRRPIFQLIVGNPVANATLSRSNLLDIHTGPMTPWEKAVWLTPLSSFARPYHRHRPGCEMDLRALSAFASSDAIQLASRLKSLTVRQLATVTALDQISVTRPEVIDQFVGRYSGDASEGRKRRILQVEPILFQERLMTLLNRRARISLEQAFEFIKAAAGDRLERSEITSRVRQQLLVRCKSPQQAERQFQAFASAGSDAVCLAHHLANAKTIHRAALLSAYDHPAFRQALERYRAMEPAIV